jgi:signal transduction histidine kinase/ActR/RegA family two-component response regulator
MVDLLQSLLVPRRFFEGSAAERQRSMLVQLLVVAGIAALIFYFIHSTNNDPINNVWGAVGYFVLLALFMAGLPYLWTVNAYLLWTLLYLAYVSVMTGGIYSPVMVWMTIAVMPGILLLDQVIAFSWVLGAIAVNAFLLLAGRYGWIDNTADMANRDIAWALSSQLCVIGVAMYVVYIAEYLNRKQLAHIDSSNAELEKTHQALMRAQEHKVEFLASIGHELRTPMNAILGLNGLLRSDLAADPQDVEIVDHIRRSTEQLLQLVNDVLDFSQLQAGRITLQEEDFDLRETLGEALSAFTSQAHDKGVRLTLDMQTTESLWVMGDRQRLLQVLSNLLANALKFTSAGSIQVRVKSEERGFLFEVQDTGIGIAADRQKQIFLGFEHADVETNRQYGGTGLGLAICERLVSLQGGTLGLTSEQGLGSVFWFQLPLRRASAQAVKAAADVANLLANRDLKILLVDDNDVNLIVARMLLNKCLPSATVVEVSSAAVAIEKLRTQPIDIVLMDVIMPEMDGMQATQAIRQTFEPPVSDIPVLALTASANPVDQASCLDAGMNDVLLKPLDERELLLKISRSLAAHTQRVGA